MQFEELDRNTCVELLSRQVVGRLAVVLDGAPHVFPVNYRMIDAAIVIRTDPGTKLTAADLHKVAFEIDHADRWNRKGWSVVAHGRARDITSDPSQPALRQRSVTLHPWAPGPKTHWLVIDDPVLTGRRITWDQVEQETA